MNAEKELRAIRLADGKFAVFIYQRWYESVISDVASGIILLAVVGVGVFIHSNALQWIAALMFVFFMLGKISAKNIKIYTPEKSNRVD